MSGWVDERVVYQSIWEWSWICVRTLDMVAAAGPKLGPVRESLLLHSKRVICALVGRVCQLDPRDNGARCQSAQVRRKVQQRRATQVLNQGCYTYLTTWMTLFFILLKSQFVALGLCFALADNRTSSGVQEFTYCIRCCLYHVCALLDVAPYCRVKFLVLVFTGMIYSD